MGDSVTYKINAQLGIELASFGLEENIQILEAKEIRESGEEALQLMEGCRYEYLLPENFRLKEYYGITKASRFKDKQNQGTIEPGLYVGRLPLTIINTENHEEIDFAIEVRSKKAEYRTEYRNMLEDITEECTELLLQHSSPSTQRYSLDYNQKSESLYQKFALIKSFIDTEEFNQAVNRVVSMPVTRWEEHNKAIDVRRVKRIGSKALKQFARSSDRIELPKSHTLRSIMKTVPRYITVEKKVDTVDTPENRFIKHVLKEFERLATLICEKASNSKRKASIYYEAKELRVRFTQYLSHEIFKEVGIPTNLPLNSPILQRKSGYREILRTWLMYDLAGKLTWDALESDEYSAGKRDVATLYEYWLFFKLLRIVEKVFHIPSNETKDFIEPSADGLALKLKAGSSKSIKGTSNKYKRGLSIRFSFNRTFSFAEYPKGGSWTQRMRPDYTLSIWPSDFDEKEAEEQELIVHLHFDAKYKVEDLNYFYGSVSDEDSLDVEKRLQKQGKYKRADLLKMHAYKDAIRRTVGAYVLYPGTKSKQHRAYGKNDPIVEILPGLGAFPVSPSKRKGETSEQLKNLETFLEDVVKHFANRVSKRESLSFYEYEYYKDSKNNKINDALPEYEVVNNQKVRPNPIREQSVLIGYCKTEEHLQWVEEKKLYNIRVKADSYDLEVMNAKYILLYTKGNHKSKRLWKVIRKPKLKEKDFLINKNYPSKPSKEKYFVYSLKEVEPGLKEVEYDIKLLKKFSLFQRGRPFSESLEVLLKTKVNGTL